MIVPLLFVSPPLSFIDDTKVQVSGTTTTDRKTDLLNSCWRGNSAKKETKAAKLPNAVYLFQFLYTPSANDFGNLLKIK